MSPQDGAWVPTPSEWPCAHSPKGENPHRMDAGGETVPADNSYTAVPHTAGWREKESRTSSRCWGLACETPSTRTPQEQDCVSALDKELSEARARTPVLDQATMPPHS